MTLTPEPRMLWILGVVAALMAFVWSLGAAAGQADEDSENVARKEGFDVR